MVLKTDLSPKGTRIFNLITSLAGINKVEKARQVFSCFSLQTSLRGWKPPPTPRCCQNIISIYSCVCLGAQGRAEGWGSSGQSAVPESRMPITPRHEHPRSKPGGESPGGTDVGGTDTPRLAPGARGWRRPSPSRKIRKSSRLEGNSQHPPGILLIREGGVRVQR